MYLCYLNKTYIKKDANQLNLSLIIFEQFNDKLNEEDI